MAQTTAVKNRAKTPVQNEWPFTMELIARSLLIVDERYQRPAQPAFINRLVSIFDPTLVGAFDVSARSGGKFAILDGRQRNEVLAKFNFTHVWCARYEGMKLADEASFFYRRNKDRKSVHPYYQFRARVAMGETKAQRIERIIKSNGFQLHINANPDDNISAIKAVEDTFDFSSQARRESLTPTLQVIRVAWEGRKGAKDGEMLRGLGRFFQPYYDHEIDLDRLIGILESRSPMSIIGQARDKVMMRRGHSAGYEIARYLVTVYNRDWPRKKRLSLAMLAPKSPRK